MPAATLARRPCRVRAPRRQEPRRPHYRLRSCTALSCGEESRDGCQASLTPPEGYFAVVGGRCKADPWDAHEESPRVGGGVAQFIGLCRKSKWSRHLTTAPLLARRAPAGSNAASTSISAGAHAGS